MLMYMSIKNKPFRDNIQRALKSRKISAIFFDEKGKRNLLIKISGQAKQWQYIDRRKNVCYIFSEKGKNIY